eukprot:TRINITY_DN10516_c0_g1_i1.p1 TRINITY_DN10516_c0_g1~~TRINITY_DN10516_c0_g1_i1.p1  ORF type:complete len:544 (+),score=124.65 TRINITY_DN10516_c0_g1_i1:148-1632(+)
MGIAKEIMKGFVFPIVFKVARFIKKEEIEREVSAASKALEYEILGTPEERAATRNYHVLPEEGLDRDALFEEMNNYRSTHKSWADGKISGGIYGGTEELTDITSSAFRLFTWTNPLHPELFKGLRKMEAEVISMVVNLFNGDTQEQCGAITSGGTESILSSIKAHRDYARDKRGITRPNMIIPFSAHAAFQKGCHYFGIKPIIVPVDETTYAADINAMRRAVNRNTIMIVGSACGFPHGIVDDIEALGQIALEWGCGLHVDCCLGSFMVCFMEAAGYNIAPFDFRVEGVTAISCDTHKYGLAPKGSSVVMYRTHELRTYQYFVSTEWSGGNYASPGVQGSRPGTIIAGAWAIMMSRGRQGYIDNCRRIIGTQREIEQGLREMPHIRVLGNPIVSVVAFTSDEFDIYRIGELLHDKGWSLNNLQFPAAIHLCCVLLTDAETFLNDVRESIEYMEEHPDETAKGSGAIYGTAAAIPDRSIVGDLVKTYLNTLYKVA